MTLEGEPTSAPAGTTIVYANQKSGGPRVFGALAMLIGGIGVIFALLAIAGAGTAIENVNSQISDGTTSYGWWFYVTPLLSAASSGLFAYAGFLLWNYKRQGVWMGFGSVAVWTVNGVIDSIIQGWIEDETDLGFNDLVGLSGGELTSVGIAGTLLGAVCCGLIVALPLLMNGNDLDDE